MRGGHPAAAGSSSAHHLRPAGQAFDPFLAEIAVHYSTLRQVTRDDVTGWLDGRKHQANDASALRDLFRTLKSKRLVFTNPTDRVRVRRVTSRCRVAGARPLLVGAFLTRLAKQRVEARRAPRGFTNSDGDLGKQFRPEC